jgi:hypothetical protein
MRGEDIEILEYWGIQLFLDNEFKKKRSPRLKCRGAVPHKNSFLTITFYATKKNSDKNEWAKFQHNNIELLAFYLCDLIQLIFCCIFNLIYFF